MPHLNTNGINLYYEITGSKVPVLFIHGLGASTRDWEYQLGFFSKDFQVITFDLRGHGQSDKPNVPYSVAMFAKDTAGLIEALAPQGLHVVGHSLGGMVAFQLALDHPELVKSLTIVNSAPAVIFPSISAHFKFFLRSLNVKLFGMKYLSKILSHVVFPKPQQLKLREEFIKRWCENDPQAYLNALKAFKNWNLMDRLGEIKCPTLIISAEHDYTPLEFKEEYAQKIANSTLVVINDSWHLTIVDQADIFNTTVDKFLKS